jgi:hypothetical protein
MDELNSITFGFLNVLASQASHHACGVTGVTNGREKIFLDL